MIIRATFFCSNCGVYFLGCVQYTGLSRNSEIIISALVVLCFLFYILLFVGWGGSKERCF